MPDKESAEYGFMATLDGHGLCVTDSNGGGTRYSAYSRTEVVESIAGYIRLCADMLADCMADDLFDGDEDQDGDEDG